MLDSILRFATALAVIMLGGCATQQPAPPTGAPRLVVLITVDQARHDYMSRFGDLFDGGLGLLIDQGVSFTQARHQHAVTVTSAGHAAIATGSHPSKNGIIGNHWFERDSDGVVYSVGDDKYGISPRRLEGDTLGDWLKQRYRDAKVYAVGGKDRGAVLLGGKRPDGVFWWDRDEGGFVSSSYYRDPSPQWLESFNESARQLDIFTQHWDINAGMPEDLKGYDTERLSSGVFRRGYPHVLGGLELVPGDSFYGSVLFSPEVDHQVVRLANKLVEQEELGMDNVPDLLALSLSALDTVGHGYGPNSPEVLDVLLRMDNELGELFESLMARIGKQNILIIFSSDHGVMALPEYLHKKGRDARRVSPNDIACYRGAAAAVTEQFGDQRWIRYNRSLSVYFDHEVLVGQGMDADTVADILASRLEQCSGVAAVYTRAQLAGREDKSDPYLTQYRNSFHPTRSPDVMTRLEPYILSNRGQSTNHGSPYVYDARVPLIFYGLGDRRQIDEPVGTVDIAPTLADVLGVAVPQTVNGRSLMPLVPGSQ